MHPNAPNTSYLCEQLRTDDCGSFFSNGMSIPLVLLTNKLLATTKLNTLSCYLFVQAAIYKIFDGLSLKILI